jgi:RNA polymerase sigma-54 factor
MELSQQLQQSLKLNMTTELRQAINLLQFSANELVDFIKEQAEENPLLEIREKNQLPLNYQPKKLPQLKGNPLENMAVKTETYIDQLLQEIRLMNFDKNTLRIITYLIDSLDERGYLDMDSEQTKEVLLCTDEELEDAILTLQSLTPSGIGARNIQECLTIQLQRLDHDYKELTLKLIQNLELVAANNWQELEKICQATIDEVKSGIKLLKTLNPKPLSGLPNREHVQYIFPDIIVNKKNEKYEIIIDGNVPDFSYNKEIYTLSKHDDSAHKYVYEKYKQFKWLQKGLEQRKRTMESFVQVFLQKQNGLIKHGKAHLRPMTMKEIAIEMEVHESTVSRVVRNKYMQTPLGMFALRDMFTSSIETSTGDVTSSASVKQKIQELILTEDKKKPLSDQKIVERLLQGYGIQISRRTVAKYREQMQIVSSAMRKVK